MKEDYLSFEKAREYVHNIGLNTSREWKRWSNGTLEGKGRRPNFIPSQPDVIYKNNGWVSWTDWIKKKTEYLPFDEARKYIRSMNFKNSDEWQRYYQGKLSGFEKPENIPWNPQKIYPGEWKGIKDWLGTKWRDYKEARDFVRNLGLNGQVEWRLYSKNKLDGYEPRPLDIPTDPKKVYENDGWIDMADWLGTYRKRRTNHGVIDDTWLSYEDAKEFVHSLKLISYDEWKAYIDNRIEDLPARPIDLPKSPQFVYRDYGWVDWTDWLGNDNIISEIDKKHIIKQNEKPLASTSEIIQKVFTLGHLKDEYAENATVSKIINFLTTENNFKSIVELELNENDINEIEKLLFQFRGQPSKLIEVKKAFVGLVFLIYVVYKIESKLSYSSIWKVITHDLEQYSKVTTYFLESYFNSQNYPNYFLKEAIEYACNTFNLRNNFDAKDEQQYIRNTILLQIGLLNKSFDHLKLWLSNINLPVIVSELLNVDSQNYSKEFNDAWRVLRRFRDNILTSDQAKSILSQNVWFQHINLDELLKASKQRAKKQLMMNQEEDLPVFYLDKIQYTDNGLLFTINTQDLYSLNLTGLRYEIFVDDKYCGVLIANSTKELILEAPIVISNPEINQIDLEVRNEDGDIVYRTEIILFDFSEQMILFDEDGNIYQNIFKKLNSSKKYHILMDSDLDCVFNDMAQREYFEGYATLVPYIGYKDDCKVTYNDELLFELNFTEYIEKPEFIDQLVLYTVTNQSFILDNEYDFILKIMKMDSMTEEVDLLDIPSESKIIKWSYSGGYADNEDILNVGTLNTNLYPEMITSPKHTLLIRYKNKVFKKVIYCNFFEKQNRYRLFKISSDGTTQLVAKTDCLSKQDMKKYRYYLSDFGRIEHFYIKNKSCFYQTIKPNRLVNFAKFVGFGETIFITEHLFNSELINIFDYRDTDEYISILNSNLNNVNFNKEIPETSKLILLDKELKYHELSFQEIKAKLHNGKFISNYELISAMVLQGTTITDSSYDIDFLDSFYDHNNFEVVKNLFLSNYPFLIKQSFSSFLKKFILNNTEKFFETFYNDKITINNNSVKLDFSKFNIIIEHILFGVDFDVDISNKILQTIILNRQVELLIDTPIVLFKLLLASRSKRLISHFYSYLHDIELVDERDEGFIEHMVENLFNINTLKGAQKHNLKIAMHYMNGKFYLKKAMERLNG